MSDIGKLFIALRVKDARKSAEFYKQLGFTPENAPFAFAKAAPEPLGSLTRCYAAIGA